MRKLGMKYLAPTVLLMVGLFAIIAGFGLFAAEVEAPAMAMEVSAVNEIVAVSAPVAAPVYVTETAVSNTLLVTAAITATLTIGLALWGIRLITIIPLRDRFNKFLAFTSMAFGLKRLARGPSIAHGLRP